MIVSFHPCFEADLNLICAGRKPGPSDLAAIRQAKAVILSQGCSEQLYRMARKNCPHVFPCWDAKFNYPGKNGQIKLFRKYNISHPQTFLFKDLADFQDKMSRRNNPPSLPYPFVLKLNWGGEGEGVFFISSEEKLRIKIKKIEAFETSGHKGFMIQNFVPCANRSLRVVVIGEQILSYWRVQENKNTFFSHVSKGAHIDYDSNSDLQHAGQMAVKNVCLKTGINLAGFDLLFPEKSKTLANPAFFIEINYFFGRSGLGGSDAYYVLLAEEIQKWIKKLNI
ncbi:MAG: hypothetical protein PVI90_03980 [Desulfobacteraceae bacterium]|jgi:ribosomal protein S6--L-glutamate ligase